MIRALRPWVTRRLVVVSVIGAVVIAFAWPMALAARKPLPFPKYGINSVAGNAITPEGRMHYAAWWWSDWMTTRYTFTFMPDRMSPINALVPIDGIPRWVDTWMREAAKEGRPMAGIDARGWPCRALSARTILEDGQVVEVRGGRRTPTTTGSPVPTIVPYRPILPGLLINATVYALMLLSAGVLVRLTRRAWRFERGRCPACGYDRQRRYDSACPECGAETLA